MILNKKTALALFLLAAPASARPRVVATFSLLGDWARQVGGTDIDLAVLAGAGADAHAYDPSPADGRALASADVVLSVGAGFEPWLDQLWDASGGRGWPLKVSDGADLRRAGTEVDPHVWGDPRRVQHFCRRLAELLAGMDRRHAADYRRRAEAYADRLDRLDAWTRAQVAAVPPARRVLVTPHDTLGYWADRYGFRVLDTLLPSVSTEAADPSPARLAALSDKVRAAGVPAVFVDNVSNDRLARALADAAGVRLAPPLYTDALGAPGTPGDTYVGLMEHNARVIVEALR